MPRPKLQLAVLSFAASALCACADPISAALPPSATEASTTGGSEGGGAATDGSESGSDDGDASTSGSVDEADSSSTAGPAEKESTSGEATTTGGSTSTGVAEDRWAALSDEFDDADELDTWTLLHEVDDAPEPFSLLEVADGQLVVEPAVGGWYGDWTGFFMFREVSGDFMIETDVVVTDAAGSSDPDNPYNSAGLLLRDPDSAPGAQTWMTYNVGMQDHELGTEAKLTIDSMSYLDVTPGAASGVLRICRVGDAVHYARKLEGETEFTVTDTYDDVPLPDTVQAGVMTTTWNATGQEPDATVPADHRVAWDYVRFSPLDDLADCTD